MLKAEAQRKLAFLLAITTILVVDSNTLLDYCVWLESATQGELASIAPSVYPVLLRCGSSAAWSPPCDTGKSSGCLCACFSPSLPWRRVPIWSPATSCLITPNRDELPCCPPPHLVHFERKDEGRAVVPRVGSLTPPLIPGKVFDLCSVRFAFDLSSIYLPKPPYVPQKSLLTPLMRRIYL